MSIFHKTDKNGKSYYLKWIKHRIKISSSTPIHTEVTRTLQSSRQSVLLVTHDRLPTLLLHIKSEKEFSYAIESVCSIDLVKLSLFYGILLLQEVVISTVYNDVC